MKRKSILLILGLAGFTVMADNWVVSPILPSIAESISVPVTKTGLLITSYMIPFGMFQLVFGPMADRYGKRQVINFSLLFFTIATALTAVGYGLTDLAIYRAITGIFAASVMPISLALIGDLVPMEERQSAIGTFMGISFLGQGLSMAIGGSIAYFLNWRGVFIVYSILAAIVTVLLFTKGRQIPSAKNPDSKVLAPYGKLLSNGNSFKTYLVVLLEGIFILGSFSYIGAYISKTYGFNNLSIGLIMTAFGVAAIIGGRLGGKLAAKKGRLPVLLAGLSSAALANILLYLAGSNLAVLVLSVALLGLGFMLAHSTLLTVATQFAKEARGAAMSLVAFCFMGGGGIGTAIGSRFIDSKGFTSYFATYGVALVLLTLIAAVILNKTVKGESKNMAA